MQDLNSRVHMQGDAGKAGGVETAAERLQQVAAQKEGSTEELVALYVAIMRSLGLLARTIRYVFT